MSLLKPELATNTISQILALLGDAKKYEVGHVAEGNINGQIVQDLSGAKMHKAALIRYKAVVKEGISNDSVFEDFKENKTIKEERKLYWVISDYEILS